MDIERRSADDFLEDAAHYPGGHAEGVVFPRTTSEIAEAVARAGTALAIGAQSSLTGGATPMGELLIATSKMTRVLDRTANRITVEAGLTVAAMQEVLSTTGAWFPPTPTFTGASAGGIVATNAAGAATFKYGSTRDWVEGLVVVLADGTILNLKRGEHHARAGRFEQQTNSGRVSIRVPTYVMPQVSKRSAGYHAAPGMDLIDLFIGAEGTLGVIAQVTFRVLSPAPQASLALIPCRSERQALDLVLALRRASSDTRLTGNPAGIDVAAIENMDARSIAILRRTRQIPAMM